MEPFLVPKLLRAAIARKDLPMLEQVFTAANEISTRDVGHAFRDAAEIEWREGAEWLLRTGVSRAFLLRQAIYFLNQQAVEWLLDAGADLESRDEQGLTPLRQAIAAEVDSAGKQVPDVELTALLVRRGADVFDRAPDGYPADFARQVGHPRAETHLRQQMAEQAVRPRHEPLA